MMDTAKRPMDRSHHIDIHQFALQEWVAKVEVILRHILGTINPADDLTNALGWLLHHRHSNCIMGMCGSTYPNTSGRIG
jgi:hypothetical protein